MSIRTHKTFAASIHATTDMKKAMDAYKRRFIPFSQLLSDYAYLITMDDNSDAFSAWSQRNQDNGYRIESGITAEETAFATGAIRIKDTLPTQVIANLFYHGRNESRLELNFLVPETVNSIPHNTKVLVVNPSPFIVFLILRNDPPAQFTFVVPDDDVAKTYQTQYKNATFVPMTLTPSDEDYSVVLIYERDWKNADDLYRFIPFAKQSKRLVCQFCESAYTSDALRKACSDLPLHIQRVMRIDPALVTARRHKNRFVFFFEQTSDNVQFENSHYDSDSEIVTITPMNFTTTEDRFWKRCNTLRSIMNGSLENVVQKQYTCQSQSLYYFSPEIVLRYSLQGRKKYTRRAAFVYYYSIYVPRGNQKGKRLCYTDHESDAHGHTMEEIYACFDRLVLREDWYPTICEDLAQYCPVSPPENTLKTAWFRVRSQLQRRKQYNETILLELIQLAPEFFLIPCNSITFETYENQLKPLLDCSDAKTLQYLRQLHCLFDTLRGNGYVDYDPFSVIVEQQSTQMSIRQRQVARAYQTMMFTAVQEQAAVEYLTSDNNGLQPYESLGALLELFTGLRHGELCALTVGDFSMDTHLPFGMLSINKYVNQNGTVVSYAKEKNANAIRKIPVPPELCAVIRKELQRRKSSNSASQFNRFPLYMDTQHVHHNAMAKNPSFCKPGDMKSLMDALFSHCQLPDKTLTVPDERRDGKTIDISGKRGYFLRNNCRYQWKTICGLTDGEVNYLLGIEPPELDTFSKHYCDYRGDLLILYTIAQKMRRWVSRYSRMFLRSHPSSPLLAEASVLSSEIICNNSTSEDIILEFEVDADFGYEIEVSTVINGGNTNGR